MRDIWVCSREFSCFCPFFLKPGFPVVCLLRNIKGGWGTNLLFNLSQFYFVICVNCCTVYVIGMSVCVCVLCMSWELTHAVELIHVDGEHNNGQSSRNKWWEWERGKAFFYLLCKLWLVACCCFLIWHCSQCIVGLRFPSSENQTPSAELTHTHTYTQTYTNTGSSTSRCRIF